MAKDLFYQLDLNLLRTFLVLSQELNMRRASERLYVSQPAISQALQKLRNHFDDELFVKVHGGLQPTAFSESLTDAITPHLDGLSTALNQVNEFDPEKIEQKITIAIPPILLGNISGPLFLKMKRLAPHAEIELSSWSQSTPDDIRNGHTLIGIQYGLDLSKELYSNKIATLEARVIVRKNHPVKPKVADIHEFTGYEHASIISRGWNDQFAHSIKLLAEHGIKAKVGFRSELLTAVVDVTQHTNMVMAHSNLFPIEEYPNLRSIIPTINGKTYCVDTFSYFHKRNRKSALVQWLHSIIKETVNERLLYNK